MFGLNTKNKHTLALPPEVAAGLLAAMGRKNDEQSTPSPEAHNELLELAKRVKGGVKQVFKPGDLVTPRNGYNFCGHGQPYVVIYAKEDYSPFLTDVGTKGSNVTSGDIAVAGDVSGSGDIAMFLALSFAFESWPRKEDMGSAG